MIHSSRFNSSYALILFPKFDWLSNMSLLHLDFGFCKIFKKKF